MTSAAPARDRLGPSGWSADSDRSGFWGRSRVLAARAPAVGIARLEDIGILRSVVRALGPGSGSAGQHPAVVRRRGPEILG